MWFIPGMQEWINICKWINILYHINNRRIKIQDHFNRCIKSIWQNSTFIHDKNSHKNLYRGNIFQYKSSMTNPQLIYYREKIWKLSSKISNKTRMPLSLSLFNVVLIPRQSNQIRKRNKQYLNWNWRSKWSLFADNLIL